MREVIDSSGDDEKRIGRVDVWRRLILVALLIPYLILWAGGVGHYLFIGAVAREQNWIAAAFLFLAGLIVLLSTTSRADFARLIGVGAIGFLVEVCGVRYEMPFGKYVYTDVLRPSFLGVPLVMSFAWIVLVAYLQQILLRLKLPIVVSALVAAAWMTAIDLVIDPLAGNQLGYWRWFERGTYYGIPASNFAGWFVVSFLIFLVLGKKWRPIATFNWVRLRRPYCVRASALFCRSPHAVRAHAIENCYNCWSLWMGVSIILFFTLLALSFHLLIATSVGCALILIHFLLAAFIRTGRKHSPQRHRGHGGSTES